jgi:hypothetical protein
MPSQNNPCGNKHRNLQLQKTNSERQGQGLSIDTRKINEIRHLAGYE